MKVKEAIDKINAVEGWTAQIVHADWEGNPITRLNVFAKGCTPSFWCYPDKNDMRVYMNCDKFPGDNTIDNVFLVMSILNNLHKTKLSNRGIKTQKYKIRIGPGEYGYLNLSRINGAIGPDTDYDGAFWQANFSKREIEQLKQRDDIAIDWGKAQIEPAGDNE